nr:hypothetical protein [Tanacetum cinerariifolium]
MHILNEPSFFLTNKIGASQGEELGLMKPLSESYYSCSDNSFISDGARRYGARATGAAPGIKSIWNSIGRAGGRPSKFSGNTSGKSWTIGRTFNFSKYIFESLVRNVDSSSKFYMYPRRVGKGCSGVETPLFEGMLVAREPANQGDAEEHGAAEEQGNDNTAAEEPVTVVDDVTDQSIQSPTPLTPPPQQPQDIPSTSQVQSPPPQQQSLPPAQPQDEGNKLMNKKETEEFRVNPDDAQVEGRQANIYHIDMDHATKVLSMQEDEPEIQETVEVVTTAKLITEVVVAVSETVSVVAVVQDDVLATPVNVAAVVTTAPPVKVAVPSTRRKRGVVIRDLEEDSSTKTPTKTKSKDKGKAIMKKQQVELDEAYARKLQEELNQEIDSEVAMDHVKQKAKENPYVQRYQVMKKRPQTKAQARRNMMVYLKNTDGFTLDYFKGMSYDDICPIFEAKFNANMEFLVKSKEQMEEEESRAIALINETPAQKVAKRRRLNEEAKDVEELKQH